LLDAQITGDIVFRTSSGHLLDTRLDQSQLHTEAADKPLRLAGIGSYNGTPLKLEADPAAVRATQSVLVRPRRLVRPRW